MTTFTKEDLTALNWAYIRIGYHGQFELTPARFTRLAKTVGFTLVGDAISNGHKDLVEWVAYELGHHTLSKSDLDGAVLFDALQEKLGLEYPISPNRPELVK
jgi:hypothetical protein